MSNTEKPLDDDPVLRRVERVTGIGGLVARLGRLNRSDLQSLLLAVTRERSRQRHLGDVVRDFDSNRFVAPALFPAQQIAQVEQALAAELPPDLDLIELSPLAPLGTCFHTAQLAQDWAVATVRGSEVVSDPTNVLALECARRRRSQRGPTAPEVEIATSHRVVRPQFHGDDRSLRAHFRLFCWCSSGRDTGSHTFEMRHLFRHGSVYLAAARAVLPDTHGLQVLVTDFSTEGLGERLHRGLIEPLRRKHPSAHIDVNPGRAAGKGYYSSLCFHINVIDGDGNVIQLGDGGAVGWTAKILNDRKERLMISAIAVERLVELGAHR